MFCKSCGNQIDADSSFCSFCGAKQPDSNRPVQSSSELAGKVIPQTVNVNLSFGRSAKASSIEKVEEKTPRPPKYDLSYGKEVDATLAGIFLFILGIVSIIYSSNITDRDQYYQYRGIVSLVLLFVRIIAVIWVSNIAKRQNREPAGWGILAFFLPSIALIIMGQLRKLNKPQKPIEIIQNDKNDFNNGDTQQVKHVELAAEGQQELLPDDNWTKFGVAIGLMAVGILIFFLLVYKTTH